MSTYIGIILITIIGIQYIGILLLYVNVCIGTFCTAEKIGLCVALSISQEWRGNSIGTQTYKRVLSR